MRAVFLYAVPTAKEGLHPPDGRVALALPRELASPGPLMRELFA